MSRLGRIAGRDEASQLLQRYASRGVVESRLIASPTSRARITLSAVPMPVQPNTAVAVARTLLNVPWRHQGRTRQGVDCAGLVVLVGRELGLADYDTSAYGRRPEGHGFVQHFCTAMDGMPLPEAGSGDVLVFADAAYPCHCGFLTAKHGVPHLLHAHALRRKVIEEPYAGEWPLKVKLAFRFRAPSITA